MRARVDHEEPRVREELREEMHDDGTEPTAADDERRFAGQRRRLQHGVERDGERIGEDRVVEGDAVRDLVTGRLVGRDVRSEAAGDVGAGPGVHAGREGAEREALANGDVSGLAGVALGEPTRDAAEPGRARDAIALHERGDAPARLDDGADVLVAEDVRKRDDGGERVVRGRIHEDLLHVAPADAAHRGLDDDPAIAEDLRVGHVEQAKRAERAEEARGRHGPEHLCRGEAREVELEGERLHGQAFATTQVRFVSRPASCTLDVWLGES